jgi:hypothetical protein
MMQATLPQPDELERCVRERTGRQVRNLCVELRAERIVLRGTTDRYYIKQLAQQGILEILPHVALENAIVVD